MSDQMEIRGQKVPLQKKSAKFPLCGMNPEMHLICRFSFVCKNNKSMRRNPPKMHMNTRPMDRSQSGGTGPSAYGTGPTVIINLGPVPNYYFEKNFEDNALNIA